MLFWQKVYLWHLGTSMTVKLKKTKKKKNRRGKEAHYLYPWLFYYIATTKWAAFRNGIKTVQNHCSVNNVSIIGMALFISVILRQEKCFFGPLFFYFKKVHVHDSFLALHKLTHDVYNQDQFVIIVHKQNHFLSSSKVIKRWHIFHIHLNCAWFNSFKN